MRGLGDVFPDAERIREAFRWELSSRGGCGHDYDCCGCRSHHLILAERSEAFERLMVSDEGEQLWITEVGSSRNF